MPSQLATPLFKWIHTTRPPDHLIYGLVLQASQLSLKNGTDNFLSGQGFIQAEQACFLSEHNNTTYAKISEPFKINNSIIPLRKQFKAVWHNEQVSKSSSYIYRKLCVLEHFNFVFNREQGQVLRKHFKCVGSTVIITLEFEYNIHFIIANHLIQPKCNVWVVNL